MLGSQLTLPAPWSLQIPASRAAGGARGLGTGCPAPLWLRVNSRGPRAPRLRLVEGGRRAPGQARGGGGARRGARHPRRPVPLTSPLRSATMAVLAALLRAGARGRSPLLRRQLQVRAAGGTGAPPPALAGCCPRPRDAAGPLGLGTRRARPSSGSPPVPAARAARFWPKARFRSGAPSAIVASAQWCVKGPRSLAGGHAGLARPRLTVSKAQ